MRTMSSSEKRVELLFLAIIIKTKSSENRRVVRVVVSTLIRVIRSS